MNYEAWLLKTGVLSIAKRDEIRARLKDGIEDDLKHAFEEPEPVPVESVEVGDVYAPMSAGLEPLATSHELEASGSKLAAREIRMIDAIQEGLAQSMERHPKLVLMGQDIAEYGGAFKITDGFVERSARSACATRRCARARSSVRRWASASRA
jgi:2-oxoisovalerate dehydrogenase E1 component